LDLRLIPKVKEIISFSYTFSGSPRTHQIAATTTIKLNGKNYLAGTPLLRDRFSIKTSLSINVKNIATTKGRMETGKLLTLFLIMSIH